MRRRVFMASAASLALGLTGCAAPGGRGIVAPETETVWPPPPDRPQYRLTGVLDDPDDLYTPGTGRRLLDLLAGPKETAFARPHGLAVSADGDFYVGALSADNAQPSVIISNNVFYDNNLPLSAPCETSIDASNTFHDPSNLSVTNNLNGIFTYARDEFTVSTTWSETEVPYVINDNDLYIEGSLILANDVIVKFTPGSAIIKEPAATFIYNSTNYFTSFKDDAHGGDTNGDGNTSPQNADWWGMAINDTHTSPICGSNILYADNCSP